MTFDEASKEFRLTSNFKKIKLVQLQATENCLINEVKKIIDARGELIVLTDDDEIFCFRKNDGTFLRQIGGFGESSGEYIEIGDIYYNEKDNTVNIIDNKKGFIVTYGLEGNFVSHKKMDVPVSWMESAERSTDGYMMICNRITGGTPASEFAYTILRPNEEYSGIDPFAPIGVKGFTSTFASRPMAVGNKGFTFLKFLNDTVFTMDKGEIRPLYKLSMKKKMPDKDVVAQMGSFSEKELWKMCRTSNYFSGFDKLFETKQYIVLIPKIFSDEGYYWIDKTNGKGIHVPSFNEFALEVDMMLQGRSIINIVSCNDCEIISCFNSDFVEDFRKELTENPDMNLFDARLKPFFENADSEGNPCLVIYEN